MHNLLDDIALRCLHNENNSGKSLVHSYTVMVKHTCTASVAMPGANSADGYQCLSSGYAMGLLVVCLGQGGTSHIVY